MSNRNRKIEAIYAVTAELGNGETLRSYFVNWSDAWEFAGELDREGIEHDFKGMQPGTMIHRTKDIADAVRSVKMFRNTRSAA